MHLSVTRNGSIYLYLGKIYIELLGEKSHAYPHGRTIVKYGKWRIVDIYSIPCWDDIDPDDIPF